MFDQEFFDKLEDYCDKGYIRKSKHPILPLTIYNYTEKTTWEGKWDNITTYTRGLVIDHTQKPSVFIQGPKKFFNTSLIKILICWCGFLPHYVML